MAINILSKTILEWSDLLLKGEVSSLELTKACFKRIKRYNKNINAFTFLMEDSAYNEAKLADKRISLGKKLSLLDGIPIGVKDNIDVKGTVSTAGMSARSEIISEHDSIVVELLRKSGCVLIGKLNMHEAAFGSTNEVSYYGKTHNPYKFGYTPGGSSGGSAAAVASGFCLAALGTDTLGSVRIPASYCGVSGIKPTNGLVSNVGLIPLSWTFDTIGPITKKVEDLGPVLEIITGLYNKEKSSKSMKRVFKFNPEFKFNFCEKKVGVLNNFKTVNLESEIANIFEESINKIKETGIKIKNIYIEEFNFSKIRRNGLTIVESEAASIFASDLNENPDKLSDELVSLLSYGKNLSSTKLVDELRKREVFKIKMNEIFKDLDFIILPTTPILPFKFGESHSNQADFTSIANLSGNPALSLTMGISKKGFPIGFQIIGRHWEESNILQFASTLDKLFEQNQSEPDLISSN
ncbi:amidase [Alphaproteobacteria bacterium]|nr:amidase [Alphaproteobacteria bacterium]